jgi:hypothetical protein
VRTELTQPTCPSAATEPRHAPEAAAARSPLRHVGLVLRGWLQHRHLPWHLALIAMLLCMPALRLGWLLDDDFHRAALTKSDIPALSRSPTDLFAYIKSDEAANRTAIALGMLPWWSREDLRIAFYRPLTSLTHWLDYQLWPQTPSLMHLHSLIWFGGAVLAAAFFYRRMLGRTWIAGLAALLFAVDDAHGLPAVWLANRNALLGALFGILTLIAHDRWRRDGWRPGAALAPLALLLGLLAKESSLAIGAYLLAYALFLDQGTRVGRLCSLAPCALTGLLWWLTYKELGYGVAGSAWYLDPLADPVQFARAVAARAPMLLAWQWLVPSDLQWELSPQTAHTLWLATMGFLVVMAAALAPILRRDRHTRFFALGMVLAVLPACAAFPADRLLFFVGIGAMGLIAQYLAATLHEIGVLPSRTRRRLPACALCLILVFIHLGVAPVTLARTTGTLEEFGRSVGRAGTSLPSDLAAPFQTVLIVSTPSYTSFAYGALTRLLYGPPYFSRTLVLGTGSRPIEIRRQDDRSLLLRPEGGFLAATGALRPDRELGRLLFDERRTLLSLDRVYRDDTPMTAGRQFKLLGVTIEITAVTDDGRPAEATCRFAVKLESRLLRWLRWDDGAYVPFNLPAVGRTITLPAATVPLWEKRDKMPASSERPSSCVARTFLESPLWR